jgi:hypothetical protein
MSFSLQKNVQYEYFLPLFQIALEHCIGDKGSVDSLDGTTVGGKKKKKKRRHRLVLFLNLYSLTFAVIMFFFVLCLQLQGVKLHFCISEVCIKYKFVVMIRTSDLSDKFER